MSRITAVLSAANTLMLPLVPAGTTAALDLMRPSSEFRVEATGRDCPAGHNVRRSEEHTSELQSLRHLGCRLLLEKTKRIDRLCCALYVAARSAVDPCLSHDC